MKKILSLFFLVLITSLYADIPYYNGLDTTLRCGDFKTALSNKINSGVSVKDYDFLIGAHAAYDIHKSDDNLRTIIWDMYSDNPIGPEPYEFIPITDKCGDGINQEGSCYNREHSTPASWYGDAYPMYSDFFNVVPTDYYVNGQRKNYPMAVVATATFTSQNGCKLGSSATSGISGTVFEPRNEYKGDFARIFLYMAVRYQNVINTLRNGDGAKVFANNLYPSINTPALKLYIQWHNQDPPSQKEINRNNGGQTYQGNRNPFVDHPEWVYKIWGTDGTCPPLNPVCNRPLPVTNIVFSNITSSSFQGSFTPSTASGFLIVVSQGALNTIPVNGVTYFDNQAFGNGQVIEVGTSNAFSYAGALENTNYTISVFPYNNTNCSNGPVYTSIASNTVTTLQSCTAPTTPITNLTFIPSSTSMNIVFTPSTTADRYMVLYSRDAITFNPPDGNNFFTNEIIGNDTIGYVGSSNNIIISGLQQGVTYFFKIIPFNYCNGSPKYGTGIAQSATTTAICNAPGLMSNVNFTTSPTSILSTYSSVSNANKYMVIYSAGIVTFTPQPNTSYVSGQVVGNDTIGYIGANLNATINNLTPNQSYNLVFYPINACSNGEIKFGTPKSYSVLTQNIPCITPTAVSNISISNVTSNSIVGSFDENGSSGYLVIISNTAFNGTIFNGNNYTVGQIVGNGEIISTGLNNNFIAGNLNPSTVYVITVFAYKTDCQEEPAYSSSNSSSVSTQSFTACNTPTTLPSNIIFNNVTKNSLTLNFSPSSLGADGYLVFYNSNSYSGIPSPTNGITYLLGVDYGTFKVAYFGPNTSFTLNTLTENTRYYFKIYPYNNNNCNDGPKYNSTPILGDTITKLSTAVNILKSEEFKIYPNPIKSNWITINNIENIVINDITCIDILGKYIPINNIKTEYQNTTIEFQNIATGSYILNINTTEGLIAKRFFVIK
jgi:endonuclease I